MCAFSGEGHVWWPRALWQPHSTLSLRLGLDRSLPVFWGSQLLCGIRAQTRALCSEYMVFA